MVCMQVLVFPEAGGAIRICVDILWEVSPLYASILIYSEMLVFLL